MKFLMVTTSDNAGPPSPELNEKMAKLIEEETKSGVLVMTGGLMPASMGGARVRYKKGKLSVLDGPFTESKEVIAGFAIVEVNSLAEALEASKRFYAIAGDGEGEIRRLMGPEDEFAQT